MFFEQALAEMYPLTPCRRFPVPVLTDRSRPFPTTVMGGGGEEVDKFFEERNGFAVQASAEESCAFEIFEVRIHDNPSYWKWPP